MTIEGTPAEMEFGEEPEGKAPEPKAEPKPSVDPREFNVVKEQLEELNELRSKTAIIDKLQDLFGGKPEDPKDAFIRKEIHRLVPEIQDLDKIKSLLPEILLTLQATADTQVAEKAESAQDYMKDKMADYGLNPKSPKAVAMLEEALTREIKGDPDLLKLWARGNVKGAVDKALKAVESELFQPVRTHTKRGAVRTILDAPRAVPSGGAPSPGPKDKAKVDFGDTSRDGRKKVHDAAFERLQELLDRD